MKSLLFVVVALLGHCLSSLFPFVAKRAVSDVSVFAGALALYTSATGAIVCCFVVSRSWRERFRKGVAALDKRSSVTVLITLLLYSLVVTFFYQGLQASPPGQFGFVARLESTLPFVLAIVFLPQGERRWYQTLGGVMAFGGGLLVLRIGTLPSEGLAYALLFIAISTAVNMLLPGMLRKVGPEFYFPVRFVWVTLTLLVLALVNPASASADGTTPLWEEVSASLVPATVAGLVLAAMFYCRYLSLANIPLWKFSALGASQLVFTPLFARLTGESFPGGMLIAVALFLIGEALVVIQRGKQDAE